MSNKVIIGVVIVIILIGAYWFYFKKQKDTFVPQISQPEEDDIASMDDDQILYSQVENNIGESEIVVDGMVPQMLKAMTDEHRSTNKGFVHLNQPMDLSEMEAMSMRAEIPN